MPTARDLEVKSGVVIYENQPYYYVDMISGDDGDMIIAYDLSKESIKNYEITKDPRVLKRAGKGKYVKQVKINPNNDSKLAQFMAKHLGNKNTKDTLRIYYKTAVFTSPVVYGTDTFSDNYMQGFYEMARQDVRGPLNGQYPPMEPTGVFIGLNNVYWLKDVYDFKRLNGYDLPLYQNYSQYFRILSELGEQLHG